MGTCLSKKRGASSSSKSASPPQPQTLTLSKPKLETELHHRVTPKNKKSLQEEEDDGEGRVKKKKEIFIIKHRKSHEDRNVDAILLQCGRLSRNSSGKAASSSGRRRNYSASNNTSHDFDHSDDDDGVGGENHRRRSPGACSDRRRRTPSRERDQHQRSNSRERRVSRSPSRRLSDTRINNDNINNNTTNRPGKMVSVPATVSSLCMDKSNNNGGGGIKRISVKRNVSAASPRSQSPARASGNAANGCKVLLLSENQQQQQPSLSRSSSRRAEQSPYRRNPLSEIDLDSLAFPQSANNDTNSRVQSRPRKESEADAYQKTNADTKDNIKIRTSSNKTKEQQEEEEEEEVRGHSSMTQNVVLDSVKPPHTSSLTRSRSSRRSRTDLDHILNPETLINPAQSYTSLLLEDIKNFHQKNNNNTPSCSTPLPACVAKACSILEAVANLNSTSSSTILTASSKNVGVNHYGKRNTDSSSTKDTPFVESEVVVFDDVMEPSLHKYVTVTRDMEDKESSGSNSFSVSGQKHSGFSSSSSSSLWEPNSGDSTDRWTCSTQLLSQKAHPRSRFI